MKRCSWPPPARSSMGRVIAWKFGRSSCGTKAVLMQNEELIPDLFRSEYRKIVAVLCKHFGFDQMEIAEDLASDTFLTAAETWGLKGVPANPTAWLYSVAKNRAKNYLKRDHIFHSKLVPGLKAEAAETSVSGEAASIEDEIDLSPQNID